MKKNLFIVFVLVCVILCGCSSNTTIKCKKADKNHTYDLRVNFDKDSKIVSLKYLEKIDYSKFDAHIDLEYVELKEKYDKVNSVNGVNADVKENKNDITIKVDADFNKFQDENYSLFMMSKNITRADALNVLKNAGYSCK